MAKVDVKKILADIESETTSRSKTLKRLVKKPKASNQKQRQSDISPESKSQTKDYLGILRDEFIGAPFLTVAEQYVRRYNPKNKSIENCMAEFKNAHPVIFRILFCLDLFMKSIFLAVVLVFVLRGLGLLKF